MAIYKRGKIYWYKFRWNGNLVRESTKQGNDKVARQMEAAHRTQLAREKQERQNSAERLGCDPSKLIRCAECDKWFSSDVAVAGGERRFCSRYCRDEYEKKQRVVPTLSDFCSNRFEPWAKSTFEKAQPATWKWYRSAV